MSALVIVMGVSGSGKSVLAESLAQATDWQFAEGDDYHSPTNKARMAARIPLTDEERLPWLNALRDVLERWHRQQLCGILTCSALRSAYREHLSAGLPEVRFIWLDPPRELIEERLSRRSGHFMPPELLDSQLATLEPPSGSGGSATVFRLDGSEPRQEAVAKILAWLRSEHLID